MLLLRREIPISSSRNRLTRRRHGETPHSWGHEWHHVRVARVRRMGVGVVGIHLSKQVDLSPKTMKGKSREIDFEREILKIVFLCSAVLFPASRFSAPFLVARSMARASNQWGTQTKLQRYFFTPYQAVAVEWA
uniref:Uncharacterized protein n=1 Tax=Entomoneis paludosa TaxID=265537 RepID=A0A7S2YP70_9STRA